MGFLFLTKVEVVYHSHVLEHFSKSDGKKFLQECYRVLKPNGIIRIDILDLERIVKEYLKNLELALQGNTQAQYKYEWIMLEMYDQAVRARSGGDMAA
ncbi:MAG: methyltransferase domain-containing protein [Bacteroidia bacterium]|nr:methyltransferase domain-containing protein [Bacteroidia bacterium]